MKKHYFLFQVASLFALLFVSCQGSDVSSLELDPDPVLITLATDEVVAAKGAEIATEVYYWANQTPVITSNQDWCIVSDSGSGIAISAERNPSDEESRAATVTITVSDSNETVTRYISVVQGAFQTIAEPGVYLEEYNGFIYALIEDTDSCLLVSPVLPSPNGRALWSTETIITGAVSNEYGSVNCDAIMALPSYSASTYPAVYFCCETLGDGWYLPAYEEVLPLFVTSNSLIMSEAFEREGFDAFDYFQEFHWTSTEYAEEYAYYVKAGNSNGGKKTGGSSDGRYIRAVKRILIPEEIMP